jgi:hypothetical protein
MNVVYSWEIRQVRVRYVHLLTEAFVDCSYYPRPSRATSVIRSRATWAAYLRIVHACMHRAQTIGSPPPNLQLYSCGDSIQMKEVKQVYEGIQRKDCAGVVCFLFSLLCLCVLATEFSFLQSILMLSLYILLMATRIDLHQSPVY